MSVPGYADNAVCPRCRTYTLQLIVERGRRECTGCRCRHRFALRDTERIQKHRKSDKQPNVRLYHGPFLIPPDVAESLRESPDLHRTRHQHLVGRYADADGVTWLIRCRVPDSRAMVGEIVRTPEGHHRVTAWSAAAPAPTYRDARGLFFPPPQPVPGPEYAASEDGAPR